MDLYHQLEGDGPPLVPIHAGICDSRMWDPQWRTFAAGHRVLRYDMRGFGRSPLPPEPYAHGDDLIALLERLGIERAAVVGVSLGGRVALELAVARPDLVSRLVLSAPGLPSHEWSHEVREYGAAEDAAIDAGDLDAASEINVRFWVDGAGRTPDQVDARIRSDVHEMQRRALELQIEAGEAAEERLAVEDIGDRLSEIAVPTLVIVGEHDASDMHAIADQITTAVPDSRREQIAGTAHLPSMERPAEFDRLVLGFLSIGSLGGHREADQAV
jgi:3-oxoadipate enol-lactonase